MNFLMLSGWEKTFRFEIYDLKNTASNEINIFCGESFTELIFIVAIVYSDKNCAFHNKKLISLCNGKLQK